MMQKFRICAGGVKVLSAKLLMGISWTGGLRVSSVSVQPTWEPIALARSRLCCEHGVCPGIAVEDVPALRREPGLQESSAGCPSAAELADRTARTAACGEDHRKHHGQWSAAGTRRDHRRQAGDQDQLPDRATGPKAGLR